MNQEVFRKTDLAGLPDKANNERSRKFDDALLPSDPHFDRSKISEHEFIELLLFEIKELRSSLQLEKERSSKLLLQLEQANGTHVSENSDGMTQEHQTSNSEVPLRSARRKLSKKMHESRKVESDHEKRRESATSITSNGPIAVTDGVPLSQDFRTELSAALGITTSPESASLSEELPQPGTMTLQNTVTETKAETSTPLALENLNLGLKAESNSLGSPIDKFDKTDSDDTSLRKISTPSANSYRSRIKLPTTHKIQDPKRLNSVSSSGDNEFVKSPSTCLSDETGEPSKNIEARLPRTPDGFAQDNERVFSRSETSGQYSEGSQSHYNSPFTSSPPNTSTTPTTNSYFDMTRTPIAHTFASSDSIQSSFRPSSQTPGSSFHVLSTPKAEDDTIDLFIKPEEFHTIQINVVSTIAVNPKKSDDPNCTFSINDKETGKEMWRIRKSYTQLSIFDDEIRPVVEFFGLPALPEKSSFSSTTPLKVDARRNALQSYFNTIFVMPHVPRLVLYRICRFLSLDFVNPLDDFRAGAKKEGFLIRKYKGLGTAWKVRWCQVDGPELEIYDSPGGSLLELIRLTGSQIGRQSSDTVAEERGYRHAFLILENTKSSKLSNSLPKHFFCAESDEERDDWVAAMVEFTDNDPLNGQDERSAGSLSPAVKMDPLIDDLENHGRNRSGSTSNIGHGSEIESGFATPVDEVLKELKKAKKKSRFPFRNRVSTHADTDLRTEIVPSPNPSELPILAYLDQMKLSDEPARAIFGRDIEEAFKLSHHVLNGREIPSICFRCFDFLIRTGAVYEEGIFRLSGSASSIRQLKDKFNTVYDVDLFESQLRPDMHTVAGLLKTYLRELPNPIFGRSAYSELQNMVSQYGIPPNSTTILRIRDFLKDTRNVSKVHYDLCVIVFGYLRSVISKSSLNKMSLKNVCIVFVPTLNISIDILSACLTDYDCIFGIADPIPDQDRKVIDVQIPTF